MNQQPLGNNDTTFSQLSFDCKAVGGLIVCSDRDEARLSVERAIESGIAYFDAAASNEDGLSETNLLRDLRVEEQVNVGTKIRVSG
jgi:aryl-alcohol dehydrogenase-like predicted oxidoreductase